MRHRKTWPIHTSQINSETHQDCTKHPSLHWACEPRLWSGPGSHLIPAWNVASPVTWCHRPRPTHAPLCGRLHCDIHCRMSSSIDSRKVGSEQIRVKQFLHSFKMRAAKFYFNGCARSRRGNASLEWFLPDRRITVCKSTTFILICFYFIFIPPTKGYACYKRDEWFTVICCNMRDFCEMSDSAHWA